MPRCPSCGGGRILVVLNGERQARCQDCGTRWIQDGSFQRRVAAPSSQPAAVRPSSK